MPHIHTGDGEHDHTASAYIIRTDFEEPKLILHLHKKLHKYIQFGGHIEVTETPWQAITHELLEETGYELSQLKLLQPYERIKSLTGAKLHPVPMYHNTHNFNETHFHTDIAYVFVTNEKPKHAIADTESSDLLLVSRSELIALRPEQTFESVREPGLFVFDTCLPNWEQVDPTEFN